MAKAEQGIHNLEEEENEVGIATNCPSPFKKGKLLAVR